MKDDIPTYYIKAEPLADASEEVVKVTVSQDDKVLDTRIIIAKGSDEFKRQLSSFITEVTFKGKMSVA